MRQSSIDEIKQEIYGQISCSDMDDKTPIGLGRTKKGSENILAVRLYQQSSFWKNKLNWLRRLACGEIDVKFVGNVIAIPPSVNHLFGDTSKPWHRERVRPLKIGSSISHGQVTAGTLGCFVYDKNGEIQILSNNHVIANQNDCQLGDKICQPGTYDGGKLDDDTVAVLKNFIPIQDTGNQVDAATAELITASFDENDIYELGQLDGLYQGEIEPGNMVAKFGRTTGVTYGRVTAVEVDRVSVGYDSGIKVFDSQIEIEGAGDLAFCQGGDSGSMVVTSISDGDDYYAVGLLFAGGSYGGSNGKGLTYVNYMSRVLDLLKVKLYY